MFVLQEMSSLGFHLLIVLRGKATNPKSKEPQRNEKGKNTPPPLANYCTEKNDNLINRKETIDTSTVLLPVTSQCIEPNLLQIIC